MRTVTRYENGKAVWSDNEPGGRARAHGYSMGGPIQELPSATDVQKEAARRHKERERARRERAV